MVPHGKEHQLGDVLEVMLSHDVGAMGLYRLDRDDQHVGDLPVAVAENLDHRNRLCIFLYDNLRQQINTGS